MAKLISNRRSRLTLTRCRTVLVPWQATFLSPRRQALLTFSNGIPQDHIPVPVTRGNCSKSNNTKVVSGASSNCGVIRTISDDLLADPEFMDITWRLSVTNRTPGKVLLPGLNESDESVAHAAFELMSQLVHLDSLL
jgi:hypothetical protein